MEKQMTEDVFLEQPLLTTNKENVLSEPKSILTEEIDNVTQEQTVSFNNPEKKSQRKITIFGSKKQTSQSTKKQNATQLSEKEEKKMIAEEKESAESKSNKTNMKSEGKDENTIIQENTGIEDIDQDDEEQVESFLRDSLIKSFMVIFTNDYS